MTSLQIEKITRLRLLNAGYGQIADVTGISKQTIRSWCKRHSLGGVRGKTPSERKTIQNPVPHICKNCGSEITYFGKGRPREFCTDECSKAYWHVHRDLSKHSKKSIYSYICPTCHRHFRVYGDSRRKFCSHTCYITSRFYGAPK